MAWVFSFTLVNVSYMRHKAALPSKEFVAYQTLMGLDLAVKTVNMSLEISTEHECFGT